MRIILPETLYSVQHFKEPEFFCKCCGAGKGRMSPVLLWYLDVGRATWGDAIIVTSGFRCPAHNTEVGGAKLSRHMAGLAADIKPKAGDFVRFRELFSRLIAPLPGWEFKAYPSWLHIAAPRLSVTA